MNRSSSTLSIIVATGLISPVSALTMQDTSSSTFQLGLVFSWICAFLYFCSRMPQIWLNYKRKSVQGLSISMFMCAVMGNLTYASGMILSDRAWYGGIDFWKTSLPFVIGSAGTLFFDAMIFMQSCYYHEG
jgi:uncharacterized protein with PQ loop repeat